MAVEDTPWVITRSSSPGAGELRALLSRNGVSSRWADPDSDPLIALLGGAARLGRRLPVVLFPDGSQLDPPAHYQDARLGLDAAQVTNYVETSRWRAELAHRVGLPTTPSSAVYDVLIVGAGPAGLTAAVYAASEGLQTLVLERLAPGGQAGTSALIENYPGFPTGVTGADLAAAAYQQALRFGAEVLVGVELLRVIPETQTRTARVELVNGAVIEARTAVVAPGVAYRRLQAPGVEDLIGCGVQYGSAPAEALRYRNGVVAIVGAANSAAQAALHFARHARSVTLIVRGSSLEKSMSRYLVERIAAVGTIDVRLNSEIVRAEGDGHLETLIVSEAGEEVQLHPDALFVLIGGVPLTGGVAGWLRRDDHGFLMTGRDLLVNGNRRWWPLDRDPYFLESSQPGVFVAGDVRHGSVKRVASAVGEGALAVQLIHQYLSAPAIESSLRSGDKPQEQNILALNETEQSPAGNGSL